MRKEFLKSLVIIFLLNGLDLGAFPRNNSLITVRLGFDLDRFPLDLSKQQSIEAMLSTAQEDLIIEAKYILVGMIYGYRLKYRPADRAHKQSEKIELIPLGSLPNNISSTGEHVRVYQAENDGISFYYALSYKLSKNQRSRRALFRTSQYESFKGQSALSYIAEEATDKKRSLLVIRAIQEAVKDAVRKRARKTIIDKPHNLEVTINFIDSPILNIVAGEYRVQVNCSIGDISYNLYLD